MSTARANAHPGLGRIILSYKVFVASHGMRAMHETLGSGVITKIEKGVTKGMISTVAMLHFVTFDSGEKVELEAADLKEEK